MTVDVFELGSIFTDGGNLSTLISGKLYLKEPVGMIKVEPIDQQTCRILLFSCNSLGEHFLKKLTADLAFFDQTACNTIFCDLSLLNSYTIGSIFYSTDKQSDERFCKFQKIVN